LSAQLNCIGALTTPKLVSVINEIIEKCNKSSKRVSLMVKNVEEYKLYKEKGVSNFVHTIDSYQLKTAFINILENIKHTI
jgi:2-keto-3-deoxy-L-rhamnonate aldolase RhmA